MEKTEGAQVQEYLRRKFDNQRIKVKVPEKPNAPVEVMIGDEFVGVIDKDEDEGELCYHFQMSILDIDLEM